MSDLKVGPVIFLNYRRQDSVDVTSRLHDDLEYALGPGTVFQDLTVNPGDTWPDNVRERLDECKIVLVVIGRDWLQIRDEESGERRLDSPTDWVRLEIERALANAKIVVPILVRDQVAVPKERLLPSSIRALQEHQSFGLDSRPGKWHACVQELLDGLAKHGMRQIRELAHRPERTEPSFIRVIDYFFTRIGQATTGDSQSQRRHGSAIDCRRMRELWQLLEDPTVQHEGADHGLTVRVPGLLSPYAPLLIGQPKHKRRLHLDLRQRSVQLIEHLGLEFGELLNGILSYSAGQLVVQPYFRGTKYVYLGLYESIVRNSIPVMVERHYYDTRLAPFFRRQNTLEVLVQGYIEPLENYTKAALDEFGFTERIGSFLRPEALDHVGEPACAIVVTGEDGSMITLAHDAQDGGSAPRYLDGDIWVANGANNLITRFVDIADREDVLLAVNEIVRESATSVHGRGILSSFDTKLVAIDDRLPDQVLSGEQLANRE